MDYSAIIRERLGAIFSDVPQVETISQAKDLLEATELVHKLNPEVVMLDILMPGGSGIGVLREVKEGQQPPLVIVLSDQSYPRYRGKCMDAGADFFFDKSSEFDKVTEVLSQLN